jgi:hypothetical protein
MIVEIFQLHYRHPSPAAGSANPAPAPHLTGFSLTGTDNGLPATFIKLARSSS